MNKKLSDYRKRPHWSYSSLNSYLNICSLQWSFRYIYREKSEHTPVNLVFGTAFHNCCEIIAKARKDSKALSIDESKEIFSECWTAVCKTEDNILFKESEDFNALNEKGQNMIEALVVGWPEDEKVADIAKAFCVPIVNANGVVISEKPLIGEIDLVARNAATGETILVDWKTSAQRYSEAQVAKHFQATCFSYAWRFSESKIPLFRFDVVTKTKSSSYTQFPTQRGYEDFARMAKLVEGVERAIASEVFLPTESYACAGCQYSSACRAWHRRKNTTISTPLAA